MLPFPPLRISGYNDAEYEAAVSFLERVKQCKKKKGTLNPAEPLNPLQRGSREVRAVRLSCQHRAERWFGLREVAAPPGAQGGHGSSSLGCSHVLGCGDVLYFALLFFALLCPVPCWGQPPAALAVLSRGAGAASGAAF